MLSKTVRVKMEAIVKCLKAATGTAFEATSRSSYFEPKNNPRRDRRRNFCRGISDDEEAITAETQRIQEQISALDSERSAIQDLAQQAQLQSIDLVEAWRKGSTAQKQELVRGFFSQGLPFSNERKFFEPRNRELRAMQMRWLQSNLIDGQPEENIGAGDGI